uniref:Uncharacterized protein n=1 Tax=Arundo donax TaxID=35708 RepID=A0A0A9GGF8_ARUDO
MPEICHIIVSELCPLLSLPNSDRIRRTSNENPLQCNCYVLTMVT